MGKWIERKIDNRTVFACPSCNYLCNFKTDQCPNCGIKLKQSGFKRFLSWIVLIVLDYLAMVLVALLARIAIGLGQNMYENHPALYWMVVFGGGLFGLGIVGMLAITIPAKIVDLSEKICESKKGLRYGVLAWVWIAIFVLDLIYGLVTSNYTSRLDFLVNHIAWTVVNLFIFLAGRSAVKGD